MVDRSVEGGARDRILNGQHRVKELPLLEDVEHRVAVARLEEIAPADSPLEFFVARPVVWGRLTLSALGQKAETVNGRCRPLVT
jgi:hypothetical protein